MAIPVSDMKRFVDALKKSIRQRHNKSLFEGYMRKGLGSDFRKWKRIVEGNSGPLGEIVEAYIAKEGALSISEEGLRGLFKRYQSKGADLDFLREFVGFLKDHRQDALELKGGL